MNSIVLKHQEGLQFLSELPDNSVALILTDPPYITSRDTGMDKWVKHVTVQDKEGAINLKTEEEWENYKTPQEWDQWFASSGIKAPRRASKLKKLKSDFLKYGSIYGKKYAVGTNYGDWDSEFTLEKLELFIEQFYRVLRPGGTCIVFLICGNLQTLKILWKKLSLNKSDL